MRAAESPKPSVDQKYIRPHQANNLMKMAQGLKQTVYICGVTGYGKTSLAADFLARRRYEYYSMGEVSLAQIELPASGEWAGPERIIVVDDLHQIQAAEREGSYDILKTLAASPRIWLILISRCPLPGWLKPLYIERIFVTIGEKELTFAHGEQDAYLAKWSLSLMPEAAARLRELSAGQPLFLRIAALRLRTLSSGANRLRDELNAIEAARKDWWDYLEAHVYNQWDVELQEFLMDIAIVEQFDLWLTQAITKKSHAGKLIRQAQETGSFLIEQTNGAATVWALREPMKLSMRRRLMAHCTREHIDDLYLSAGNSYELREKIPEALAMYEKCRNEEGVSRLLIQNARKPAGAGCYWELRQYYLALSEDRIRKSPELMAGMSLLQSILLNDEESERWYQALAAYAKEQTGSVKRAAQARLLYLDISLPQRGTAQMTEILKHAWAFIAQRKILLPEVSLTNNQPSIMHGGKDFCEWSRRDRELAGSIGGLVEALLGGFGKGLVQLALAESFFEKGGEPYEVSSYAQKGRLQAQAGGKPELVFVAVGILAQLSVMNNRLEDALEQLESFRGSAATEAPQLLASIDALKAQFLLYGGRRGNVADWMSQAPDEDAEFCTLERYRYVVKARGYLFAGRNEKARDLLERLLLFAQRRRRTHLQIETLLLLAAAQARLNDGTWPKTLQRAISQAESYHFVRVLANEGAALWRLLRTRDFVWQDDAFKKQVFKECEHMAQLYPGYLSEKREDHVQLSDKALMVLRLQAEGLNVEQIARQLNLSKAGVKYYNQETYRKLGVSNKAAAINEAKNRRFL